MNPLAFQALLIPALTVIAVTGILAGTTIYRRYTGLPRSAAALVWLLAVGMAASFAILTDEKFRYGNYHYLNMNGHQNINDLKPGVMCAVILLPLLTVPFVVRLYRKWIGGHLTDAEKLSGRDGVRAWLSVGNVICAALIPFCVWLAFGVSLAVLFALTFGLVLAYPLFNLATAAPLPATAAPPEDLSNEREKVLQLLEAGKINADESADLLNALGQSVPPRPPPASEMELSPPRKMVLIGAALLLVGFFLPWFAISPGAMLHDMVFQQSMFGVTLPANVANMMPHVPDTGTVQVHAGDIAHGLGWWILALGMVAAVLPFFATTLEATLQKKIILAALGVGVFLLIYLLSNSLRYANLGVLLALAGYALEVVGTLKECPAAR